MEIYEKTKSKYGYYSPYKIRGLEISDEQILEIDTLENFADFNNPLGNNNNGIVFPYRENHVFKQFYKPDLHESSQKELVLFNNETVIFADKIVLLNGKFIGSIMKKIEGFLLSSTDVFTPLLNFSFNQLLEAVQKAIADVRELSEYYMIKLNDPKPEHTFITPNIFRIDNDSSQTCFSNIPSIEELNEYNSRTMAYPFFYQYRFYLRVNKFYMHFENHHYTVAKALDAKVCLESIANFLIEFKQILEKEMQCPIETVNDAKLALRIYAHKKLY